MNDALVPEWIKEIESQAEAARKQSEREAQRQSIASLTIQAEGPEFWRQLLRELAINTDALPKIGIRGTTSPFNHSQSDTERGCRIQIMLVGAFPYQTYTDLFYIPGSPEIRGHTLEGGVFKLRFCLERDNKVVVILEDEEASHLYPFNAEKTAEMIVKGMVNRIRRKAVIGA